MNIEDIGELMILINGNADDESDDIVSETRLYDYFCKAVKNLDELSLDAEKIAKTIETILEAEDDINKEKLIVALRVMVYAYISGRCLKQIADDLQRLRG